VAVSFLVNRHIMHAARVIVIVVNATRRSIHLSNVAVQENYVNGTRSEKIPENNFMTSDQLKDYLW